MDLALALLLLWGLLFVPIGIVLHWLVLGAGARVRALPLAPISGIALACVVLAALGRFGVDAGESWIAWGFLATAAASIVVIWRADVPWRSRELIGAGFLLLFALVLVQLPVVGEPGDGPLGYGTAADPVAEVAAIDSAANGPASDLAVARAAAASSDDRPIGFEQFAAFTVGLGVEDSVLGAGARSTDAEVWTAYGLHASITGLFAVLVTLPLFAFARARGMRWFGLIVLVPLGVLAPSVFLAVANGEGAALASVPFTTAAVFSLLVTRRDRGWWSLVVLFGSAVAVTAGPLALLPLVVVGVAWMLLRSDTYEHLSQHDTPAPPTRTFIITAATAGLAVLASIPIIAGGGSLLAWTALHDGLLDTARSWPFAWLDSDLSTAGPDGPLETAIWLIGPALLAVAVIYAVVRNERRELGVLVGAIAAAVITLAISVADEQAAIRLFEFTMLSTSPFLAALALRAVALARENAEDSTSPTESRWGGVGPSLLVLCFVLVSFAATAVTGTRMVHAPAVSLASAASGGEPNSGQEEPDRTLIAAGDPWLQFIRDGERVTGGYADADAVMEPRNGLSARGLRADGDAGLEPGYDSVVLTSSPLASDPPLSYVEQADLDAYQVRHFRSVAASPPGERQEQVDFARFQQRVKSQTADRDQVEFGEDGAGNDVAAPDDAASTDDADTGEGAVADEVAEAGSPPEIAIAKVHSPVEGSGDNTPADRPAGLLLPAADVPQCGSTRDIIDSTTCEPDQPVLGDGCRRADLAAGRSVLDRATSAAARKAFPKADRQVLAVDADQGLPRVPPMTGLQCFDVELADDSTVLLVHLRDVGLVLDPVEARATGPSGAWRTERAKGVRRSEGVLGGVRRVSSELDAVLAYGGGRLGGSYDIVLEGSFGAGVDLAAAPTPIGGTAEDVELPDQVLGSFRGAADGFSQILRNVTLNAGADVNVVNSAGTDIELGRLFARPRDLPRACDVPIALADGESREVQLDVASADGGPSVIRPGLTVAVAGIRGAGSNRVARVVVGSYLSKAGLPRYTLVDWTEQYADELEVEGCAGTTVVEPGAAPPPAPADQLTGDQLADALGEQADSIRDR